MAATPGQAPPPDTIRWVPDQDAPKCFACEQDFNLVRRRHHCRNCGGVYCNKCSDYNMIVVDNLQRVCRRCKPSTVVWKPDKEGPICGGCGKSFFLWFGRHHCRRCGDIFCSSCSTHMLRVNDKLVRACDECIKKFKEEGGVVEEVDEDELDEDELDGDGDGNVVGNHASPSRPARGERGKGRGKAESGEDEHEANGGGDAEPQQKAQPGSKGDKDNEGDDGEKGENKGQPARKSWASKLHSARGSKQGSKQGKGGDDEHLEEAGNRKHSARFAGRGRTGSKRDVADVPDVPDGPATLYWSLVMEGEAHTAVKTHPVVQQWFQEHADYVPNQEFHVTLGFIGGRRPAQLPPELARIEDTYAGREGEKMTVRVTGLHFDDGAVALAVEGGEEFVCANKNPHVTLGVAPGFKPVYSNTMLDGEHTVLECDLVLEGVITRHLALKPSTAKQPSKGSNSKEQQGKGKKGKKKGDKGSAKGAKAGRGAAAQQDDAGPQAEQGEDQEVVGRNSSARAKGSAALSSFDKCCVNAVPPVLNAASGGLLQIQVLDGPVGGRFFATITDVTGAGRLEEGEIDSAAVLSAPVNASGLADGALAVSIELFDSDGNSAPHRALVVPKRTTPPPLSVVAARLRLVPQGPVILARALRVDVEGLGEEDCAFELEVMDDEGVAVYAAGMCEGAVDGRFVIPDVDVSSLGVGTLVPSVTVRDRYGNVWGPVLGDPMERAEAAPLPHAPTILRARREAERIMAWVRCNGDGGNPITGLRATARPGAGAGAGAGAEVPALPPPEPETIQAAEITPVVDGRAIVRFAGLGAAATVVVSVAAVNSAGEGESAEAVVHQEELVGCTVALEGLDKRQLDRATRAELERALATAMGLELLDEGGDAGEDWRVPDVTIVSVRDRDDGLPGVFLEIEVACDCLNAQSANLEAIRSRFSPEHGQHTVVSLANFQQREFALCPLTAMQPVSLDRTGWLLVKVCSAVGRFANARQKETQLQLQVGARVRRSRKLVVFHNEEMEWGERFEFPRIKSNNHYLVFTVMDGSEKVLCLQQIDIVRELHPGLTRLTFEDEGFGEIKLECTWHPRTHADRRQSSQQHIARKSSRISQLGPSPSQ